MQQDTFDDKQQSEAVFYAYVAESYGCFLAGEDDRCIRQAMLLPPLLEAAAVSQPACVTGAWLWTTE